MHCHGHSWRFLVNNTSTEGGCVCVCGGGAESLAWSEYILYLCTIGQTCKVACFLSWYSVYMVCVYTEISVAVFYFSLLVCVGYKLIIIAVVYVPYLLECKTRFPPLKFGA